MFPNSAIFPIHGNHEFAPKNSQDFSNKDVVAQKLSETWSEWLTPEVKNDFSNQSYYSYDSSSHPKSTENFKKKIGKTRMIALNTENCYTLLIKILPLLHSQQILIIYGLSTPISCY